MNDGKKESYRPIQHRPVRRYGPCRGHHGRPSILLRFRKLASPVAPILSSLTMRGLWQPCFPSSARQGLRWWEVGMTWWLVRGLEATGLAWKIKLPPSRDATTGPKT